MLFMLQHIGIY